ncbi:MAG: OsmC family protein [Gemmatimonadaceae bacterium]|nr:OsmC family protein [Gemmatimonadaceae bacterium]
MHHHFHLSLRWTGNLGSGTATYRGYSRDHEYFAGDKPLLPGSSDAAFRGDATRYNPEELLVGSLASCHMLWFLHLCADAGVVVERYEDSPEATLVIAPDGGGRFTDAVLRPRASFRGAPDAALIRQLHERAHELCFLANSMNFPVRVEPAAP